MQAIKSTRIRVNRIQPEQIIELTCPQSRGSRSWGNRQAFSMNLSALKAICIDDLDNVEFARWP
jgi:hypothetical protein